MRFVSVFVSICGLVVIPNQGCAPLPCDSSTSCEETMPIESSPVADLLPNPPRFFPPIEISFEIEVETPSEPELENDNEIEGEDEEEGEVEEPRVDCSWQDNHAIRADQLPVVLDLPLSVVEWSGPGTQEVNLQGEIDERGNQSWIFNEPYTGEAPATVVATSPSEYWFADDYPNATYVSPIPGQEELVSIYERTEDGVYVLGVASISDELSHLTDIPYDPAIKVLSFPMVLGDHFEGTASASGYYDGIPFFFGTDHYSIWVDGFGDIETPAGIFSALRLRVDRTFTLPIPFYPFELTTHHKQVGFVAPCLGEIVHVTSEEDESEPDFASASFVRRIALPGFSEGTRE